MKKSENLISLINHDIKPNSAEFPIACFHLQSYNFNKKMSEKRPAFFLLIIVFVLPVLLIKKRNSLMYFSASALAGFEIIMLLTIQLIIGNMYQLTGILIAGLMAGLALGAGIEFKLLNKLSKQIKGVILIIYYLLIGASYSIILSMRNELFGIILIIVLTLLPALLTGHLFRELSFKGDSSSVYSADLAGSALGFILISGFTVPVIGIKASIFFLSSLVFIGIMFSIIRNKK